MTQELFSFATLAAEPVLIPLAVGFYVASVAGKKNKEKKRKIAWGILIVCIAQAMLTVGAAMIAAGR